MGDQEAADIGQGAAKVLGRVFARPTAMVVEKFISGPLERWDAKKRAESEIELRVINTLGDKLVQSVEDLPQDQLAALADSSSRRGVLKQFNLNRVTALALAQLPADMIKNQQETVSDEFLDTFEPIAENQSDERMQELFARILAGEITTPGSFSKRALRVAEQLDSLTARLFQLLCSMAIVRERIVYDHRGELILSQDSTNDFKVVCSPGGTPQRNSLESLGLGFIPLSTLAEYGLVLPSISVRYDHSSRPIVRGIPGDNFGSIRRPIQYHGRYYDLTDVNGNLCANVELSGVGFSAIGHELFNIVEKVPTPEYDAKLMEFFQSKGVKMVELVIVNASGTV